jgi:hypothetical protein
MKLSIFTATFALTMVPVCAHATTFDWTFGGGTDAVAGSGTLVATPDGSIAGAYDVMSGSGTLTTTYGTFAVTIVPFSGANNPSQCSYDPSTSCTVVVNEGVSANLGFDNLLFPNSAPGYQLDGDGIVLSAPSSPYATYFSMWSAGSTAAPPDQLFDPYFYTGTNLANPFVATAETTPPAVTPEPSTLLLTGTGIVGYFARRRQMR